MNEHGVALPGSSAPPIMPSASSAACRFSGGDPASDIIAARKRRSELLPAPCPASPMLDRHLLPRSSGISPSASAIASRRWTRAAAEDIVRWLVVVLGFSIPISVAADNILLAIIGGCWLLGGGYREKFQAIRDNPVALAAVALFALYLTGMFYTIGSDSEVLN